MQGERQIAASKAMRNAVMVMSKKAPGMLQVYMMLREVQVNDPKVTVRVGVSVGGPSIEYNPDFVLGMEPSMLGSIVYMNCLKVALHHFDKRKQEPLDMLKLASDIVVAEYARQVVDTSVGNNMEIVNQLFPSYWNYWPILSKHGFRPETDLVLEKIFEIFKEEYAQMQQQQQKDDKEKKEKKDQSESGNAKKKKTSSKGGNDSDEGSEDTERDGKSEQDSRPDGEDDGESGETPNGGKNGESTDGSNGNDGNDGGDNDDGTEGKGSSDDGGQGEGDSSPDESGNEGNGQGDSEGQADEGDNSGDSGESDGDSEGTQGSGGDGASGEGQDGGSRGGPGGNSSGDTDGGTEDEDGDGSGDSESGDNGAPGGSGDGDAEGSGDSDTPKTDFDRMAQYFSLTNAGSDLAKWDQDNVSRDKTTAIVQDALDKGMFDRMRGQLPLMLRNANRVKVNKESMFRRFMTSVTTDEATPSWSRRNRKYLHRGMIAPGYLYSDTQRILFCVDVSGSMQQGNAIMNCLTVIENTLDGSSIDLVYWDAVCSPVFTTPKSIKDMAIYCGGRTNPECVMRKLGPEIKKYDGVIFLTDCIFDWKMPAYSKHIMILRTHGNAPFPSWCRYCEDLDTFIGN